MSGASTIPELTVDESATSPYPSCGVVAGFVQMPATFCPDPRLAATPAGH